MGGRRGLWWRWSLRDLRQRWVSVLAISVIIAIGTGVFAGLGSTATWRRLSNDASFAALALHDVRVELGQGTTVDQGVLLGVLDDLEDPSVVAAAAERLTVTTQLDASTADETILVPGRLVGTDLSSTAGVDRVDVPIGRRPDVGAAPAEVVLEQKFAAANGLAASGDALLAGGRPVRYVGHGMQPEDFYVTREGGTFLVESGYAVVYAELADAQALTGLDGRVNELVVLLTEGADVAAVADELDALANALPGVSATVVLRADEPAYRLLYDDIGNDQQVWNALSLLVLAAATLAAFNLIGRIVDTQRREIGVQMALGVTPARIARRPLVTAAQIALLGSVFGVVVGLLVGAAMRSLLVSVLPLPEWRTPFQPGVFLRAAILGFVVPFVGSILPIRRAVRVTPVEAIRTSHVAVQGRLVARLVARLRLPGRSMAQLPLRNIVRAPRRTVLTALGVGAAIAVLVGVLGLLDSIRATVDQGKAEVLQDVPDRVVVQLDTFLPVSSAEITSIASSPLVASVDPRLEVGATLRARGASSDEAIDALVSVIDLQDAAWTPTVSDAVDASDRVDAPGIVLARSAADDLGVRPGDVVTVRHLALTADGVATVETDAQVVGVHPSPLRSLAYVDVSDLAAFGVPGIANVLDVMPATGADLDELRRDLFESPGVASVELARTSTELFDDALSQVMGVLVIVGAAVIALASLIAFNSTSISADERQREHATMFAFGVPVRSVVRLMATESAAIGAASTLVGVALGYVLVRWMVFSLISDTVPEFGFLLEIHPLTVLLALGVGVLAVGVTPVLLVRRLQRMDIPDALRVME